MGNTATAPTEQLASNLSQLTNIVEEGNERIEASSWTRLSQATLPQLLQQQSEFTPFFAPLLPLEADDEVYRCS